MVQIIMMSRVSLFVLLVCSTICNHAIVQSLVTCSSFAVFSKSTRLLAAKFDPADYITVSVSKPLGLSLEEVAENEKRGVVVEGMDDGGSAKANGKIKPGLFLVSVNGFDTKFEDFDTILDKIKSAPSPLELTFIEPKNVWKGPATITVTTPDGKTVTVKALKGQNMRTVLQGTGIVIYSSKNTYTNCGGAGNCGTCGVLVTDNADWEPRQKFEELRLKKFPSTARLSCMTDVEGDCKVEVLPAPSS